MLLTQQERRLLLLAAEAAGIPLSEFAWACLDTVMSHADDPDLLNGCKEAADLRFHSGRQSDWMKPTPCSAETGR